MLKQDYYNDFFEFGQQKLILTSMNWLYRYRSWPNRPRTVTVKPIEKSPDGEGLAEVAGTVFTVNYAMLY